MGGNKPRKSSFFSFFKAKKGRKEQDFSNEDVWRPRKVYPWDEDNALRVVAEPGIDKKASAFIANFHATRVSEAIHHQQAENEAASYEPTHQSSLYNTLAC